MRNRDRVAFGMQDKGERNKVLKFQVWLQISLEQELEKSAGYQVISQN